MDNNDSDNNIVMRSIQIVNAMCEADFGVGVRSLKIVNSMYDTDLGVRINLIDAYRHLKKTTNWSFNLYRCRPHMLVIYLPPFNRNVQLFANGKIQALGRLSPSVARSMILLVSIHLLPHMWPMTSSTLALVTLNLLNMVICIQLSRRVLLNRFSNLTCHRYACYEPELFPALRIHRWLPIHVNVFANGRCVITGLTNRSCVDLVIILSKVLRFLKFYNLLSLECC